MRVFWLLTAVILGTADAASTERGVAFVDDQPKPAIAIIIDDLGYRYQESLRAIRLRGPLTYAFLPDTPHAQQLANHAHRHNKEIMLHLPMQSIEPRNLGPGGLTLHMTETVFKTRVLEHLGSIPNVAGVNVHMGSLLTQHPGHMAWLMESILIKDDLYFVDSRTTTKTIALQVAQEHHVPSLKRDVFLDTVPDDPDYVRTQMTRLFEIARKEGSALAIGHPYPATLDVLQEYFEVLGQKGVSLVTVRDLIHLRQRRQLWHASSSHSPKVVKN